MYEILLIGPLTVLFIILIISSLKTDGKRNTLLLFGLCIIFALARELIIGLTYPVYYGAIKPVSPAIVFGWIFAFYLGYYAGERLTANTRFDKNFVLKSYIGTLIVLSISLIMETTASLSPLEWWQYAPEVSVNFPIEAFLFGTSPFFLYIGWAVTGLTFLLIFYLLKEYGLTRNNIIISLSIFIFVMVEFVSGNYYILFLPSIHDFWFFKILFYSGFLAFLLLALKLWGSNSKNEHYTRVVICGILEGLLVGVLLFYVILPASPFQILYTTFIIVLIGVFAFLIRRFYVQLKTLKS